MKKEPISDEIPAFLQEMKGKADGYKIPEGYFDAMESSVFARLEASGGRTKPVLTVTKRPGMFAAFIRPKAAMAYAAALALILTSVWFVRQNIVVEGQAQVASVVLTEEDLEFYLLENASEFEPKQLASLSVTEKTTWDETPANEATKGKAPVPQEIQPDDLDDILDEMTDEELEAIL
jgi:hypothetical protein